MVDAITVAGLCKSYGSLRVVRDVNFEVAAGEVFALLGPNGAGKTTTIEILEGFRSRDRGRVEVLGFDPAVAETSRALRERIGIVLQELAVDPFLTVREVLRRHAAFYPTPRAVDEVIELVGLSSKADTRGAVKTPVRRPATPPGRGARDHRPAGTRLPRRADDRVRPGRPSGCVGSLCGRCETTAPLSC